MLEKKKNKNPKLMVTTQAFQRKGEKDCGGENVSSHSF